MNREDVGTSERDGVLPSLKDMNARRKSIVPVPDDKFKARCLRDLNPTRALDERILAANELCQEIQHHSADAVRTLWTMTEDLATQDAPLRARRAGFALLKASASCSENAEDRYKFFSLMVNRVHPSEASLQISALSTLTKGGQDLAPFEAEIVASLNSLLNDSFLAATRARERAAEASKATYRSSQNRPNPSSSKANQHDHSKTMLAEVKGLRDIFYLIADIITHNPTSFQERQLEILIRQLTLIARKTTSRKDMHGVVNILRAITNYTQIPSSSLESCVHIVCTIYGLANIKFEGELWTCLSPLLQSEDKQPTIDVLTNILNDVLAEADLNRSATTTRGSLLIIGRIANDIAMGNFLTNHVQSLSEGLNKVSLAYPDLQFEALQTINALLFDDDIVRSLAENDWAILSKKLDAMDEIPQDRAPTLGLEEVSRNTDSSQIYRSFLSARLKYRLSNDEMDVVLHRIAERIAFCSSSYWHDLTPPKAKLIVRLLVHIAVQVPSIWEHVARLMWDEGLLRPSEDGWALHLRMVLEKIFIDFERPESSRQSVLTMCCELLLELSSDTTNKAILEGLLDDAFRILCHEQKLPASIIETLANVLDTSGSSMRNQTFDNLLAVVENALALSTSDSVASLGLSDLAADRLNRAFVNCLVESTPKAYKIYRILLLAAASTKPTRIKLKAMDLLVRLRCDSTQAVEIVYHLDTHDLVSTLSWREDTIVSPDSVRTSSNRSSLHEQPLRQGRSSVIEMTRAVRSRSATRSSNMREDSLRPLPSLETYGEWVKGIPEYRRGGPGEISCLRQTITDNAIVLDISPWLDLVIDILDKGSDWETYIYVLVHLPSQLSNRSLFARHVRQLQTLQNIIITQLERSSFRKPPQHMAIPTGDIALCLFHILTVLVAYNDLFSRRELDNAVRIFSTGLNKWDRVGKCCIHALALCCHEIPSVIDRHIFAIIQKMSQKITQADLAVDILEFLLGLARLPDACSSATAKLPEAQSGGQGDDGSFFKMVFGICTKYIQSAREQRQEHVGATSERSSQRKNRQSGMSGNATHTSDPQSALDITGDLFEYVYTLAYHVITFWFLAIDVRQRSQHVGWIAKELAWQEKPGKELSNVETLDEQSQVILDMMHRTAYSDLGETEPAVAFKDPNQIPIKKTWLLGMSIITLEILPGTNTGQLTKRQASGTTHALYNHTTAVLPEHHVRSQSATSEPLARELINVYPNHMFLQLASTIAPVPIPLQPVILPDDESTQRVLRNFDRIDTVDGHKAGVIYIGEGQKSEAEVLANTQGTEAYESFLSALGTSVKLQGAIFNTQGLDRDSNTDGTHTYAWRDRVTEIVFHVTTIMPTDLDNDPHCDSKKRHIGNDRVKIIFNESGQPFDFDTFPSDFNEVNIVVTPEASISGQQSSTASGHDQAENQAENTERQKPSTSDQCEYYRVQMLSSPSFPHLSPASTPKIISAEALPGFVRQLALNASVFCQVWSEVLGQGKDISSWRARLQEIKRLRERYGNTHESANVSYPMPTNASTYFEGDEWKGRVAMGGMAEMNQLLMSLDFTRWT